MQIPGYRIIRKINQGGMSTVYLAVQLSVGRQVALKVMSPVLNADPVFSRRFQREANIVGQLSHPNIVSIHDIGCYQGLNYIAMDYLPGGTVHERMREGLSNAEVLRITREIARALDVAHNKGYVHRDIKPENILFREDGTAVLTDFGVARTLSSAARVTNAGTVVGTPHYMSPEQSRGQPIDGRSDLYSLGVVFYEMLTGVVPYRAEEAVAIALKHLTAPIPSLPAHYAVFQGLLNRLLAKNVADRFQCGADLAEAIVAIEETLAGYPGRGTPQTQPTEMNVSVLLKALLLTSIAALRARVGRGFSALARLRWLRGNRFHRNPPSGAFGITSNETARTEQRTQVSTTVRQALEVGEARRGIRALAARCLGLSLVAAGLWTALSMTLAGTDLAAETRMPASLQQAFAATAEAIAASRPFWPASQSPETPEESAPPIKTDGGRSASPDQSSDEATAQRFSLSVLPEPADARVRILNIRERYKAGIRLNPGSYHIEVSKPGYGTIRRWVQLKERDLQLNYSLSRVYQPGETLVDRLPDGSAGPELVVIGPGRFFMGSNGEGNASPSREVQIETPFALSRHEITFAHYQRFVRSQGAIQPNDEGWGRGNRPVINVSWHDAAAYALWLSEATGETYRLPTEAEWEYAARAGSTSDYWWGDEDAAGKANCKRGCDSEYTGLFSSRTAPVARFPANPFGLYDTAGNVAEWVLDCYRDHYRDAPLNGRAVVTQRCARRPARGGAASDPYRALASHAREAHRPEQKSAMIGFRLARELKPKQFKPAP
ncbi:SUMF1/EgtB/PvdO family nonheme iron enzyme [Gilvimarinus sp. F26214L]|uniref:SUMF1/EgtB/PvdO family nonheme iron enzyme n=1 Tax=Gilvimarinus sp. DZF01 TaxID=3461371 RepID=UPI00404687AB